MTHPKPAKTGARGHPQDMRIIREGKPYQKTIDSNFWLYPPKGCGCGGGGDGGGCGEDGDVKSIVIIFFYPFKFPVRDQNMAIDQLFLFFRRICSSCLRSKKPRYFT